ncbi:MAG: glycogen-binding domain-containing protein [Gemmatimonadota bacterium]|nr:MAG: glycogen-binding domain-containing protein [Gemmatimonadota bacterium]
MSAAGPVRTAAAGLAALLVASLARSVAGQEVRVYLDAGAAHARPPADVEAEAATYAQLGGRLLVGPAFASLYGGLATDAGSADWLGGTLGATLAPGRLGPFRLTLSGLVTGFTLGEPTRYDALTGRLVPEARLTLGRATVTLRGYGGVGRSDVAERGASPPSSVESDLWMYGGGVELGGPLAFANAWAGGAAYGAAGGNYFAAYVGSAGALGRAVWTALVKVWDAPGDTELELEVGLAVPLGPRLALDVLAGRSGPDPLLGSPAGVDGSVTLSWNVLAPRAPSPLYTVSGGAQPAVTFRLERQGAETVSVIGDFSAWSPVAMRRDADAWVVEVTVEPGVYHFGFLVDGQWFLPDDAPGQVSDEFGRRNATLVVPRR